MAVTTPSTVLMVPALFNQYEHIFMLEPRGVECSPQDLAVVNASLYSFTLLANDTVQELRCTKWHVAVVLQSVLFSTAIICRLGLVFGFVILGLIADRWCPESPQSMLHNRKIDKAEITLRKAAQMNGIQLSNDFKIRPVNHRVDYQSLDEPTTCVGLLTTPNARFICFVLLAFGTMYFPLSLEYFICGIVWQSPKWQFSPGSVLHRWRIQLPERIVSKEIETQTSTHGPCSFNRRYKFRF